MTPYLPKNTLTRLAPTLGCQPYKLHHGVHGDNKLRPRLTSEEQPSLSVSLRGHGASAAGAEKIPEVHRRVS